MATRSHYRRNAVTSCISTEKWNSFFHLQNMPSSSPVYFQYYRKVHMFMFSSSFSHMSSQIKTFVFAGCMRKTTVLRLVQVPRKVRSPPRKTDYDARCQHHMFEAKPASYPSNCSSRHRYNQQIWARPRLANSIDKINGCHLVIKGQ